MKLLMSSLIILMSLTSLSLIADNGISFESPRIRVVPPSSKVTAGYGIIKNTTRRDRKLIKVESPISKVVEIHSHEEKFGVMQMRQVDFLKIRAKSQKVLEPGSYHLMFIELSKSLKKGEKVPATLYFDNGKSQEIMMDTLDF